ncbi:hypothetical protein VTO73DRAFT_13105 [Trametes versicolor]
MASESTSFSGGRRSSGHARVRTRSDKRSAHRCFLVFISDHKLDFQFTPLSLPRDPALDLKWDCVRPLQGLQAILRSPSLRT